MADLTQQYKKFLERFKNYGDKELTDKDKKLFYNIVIAFQSLGGKDQTVSGEMLQAVLDAQKLANNLLEEAKKVLHMTTTIFNRKIYN